MEVVAHQYKCMNSNSKRQMYEVQMRGHHSPNILWLYRKPVAINTSGSDVIWQFRMTNESVSSHT